MKEKNSEEIFMEELKKEFIEKTSDRLKKMLDLYENSDYIAIRKIAHDIKGTAGIFNMGRGSDIGSALQDACDINNIDKIKDLIDEMIVYMRSEGVMI